MPVKISNSENNQNWKVLRLKLQDDLNLTKNWSKAITVLHDRINERYLEPIQNLLNIPSKKGEGFSIVTIQCALIEFLSACRDGMIYKRDFNRRIDPPYYYNSSSAVFRKLLDNANIFKGYFHSPTKFSSADFYSDVRCALLHEAYTRNKWTINVTPEIDSDAVNKIIIKSYYGKNKIYRTALFNALKAYLIEYISELNQNTIHGQTLRKFLGRKLDQICEVNADGKYWWL